MASSSSESELLGICEEVEVKTSRKRKKQDSEKGKKQQGTKTRKKQEGSIKPIERIKHIIQVNQ